MRAKQGAASRVVRVAVSALLPAAVALLSCRSSTGPSGGDPLPRHPDSLAAMPSLPLQAEPGAKGTIDALPLPPGALDGSASFGITSASDATATYVVEPNTKYASLASVAPLLKPGDIVDVVGDASYRGGVRFDQAGKPDSKIIIRGVPKNGKRPVIAGGQNTIEAAGNHYVFENLDITGGSKRCFFHHANDITLRNSFVHDCPQQGILGADSDSGSLTVEYSEVARCGSGIYNHQIYMATDEKAYPGSVFRLQYSYVHEAAGGNNVKSRAERNEILYNWIEGAQYHEVELIGPDGQDPKLAREDSQVVGNVIFKVNDFHAVRIGGDGTGATSGRYRFLANTVIMVGAVGAIRLFDNVESVELFNNVFYRVGGQSVILFKDEEAKWVTGRPVINGSHNWFPEGSQVPNSLVNSKLGGSALFVSFANRDLRPVRPGVLVNAGALTTPTDPAFPFPNPILAPAFQPAQAKVAPSKTRPVQQRPSLGALEP